MDLSVGLEAPFTPEPSNGESDLHHCFVLDPALADPQVMIGYHLRPGDARVVHHVLLYLVDGADADARDAADAGPGYACSGGVGIDTARPIAGWVPGTPATRFPEGTGVPLAPGQKIVMQMHYNVSATGPAPDQTTVDLQLARAPVERLAIITPLADHDFAIPPGAEGWETTTQASVPARATLWAVAPHMHQLGRNIQVEVEHGDGTTSCLVDIPAWDFNWQQLYFLTNPLNVEQGDVARLRCVWDNTLDSTVTWGEDTGSEMCISYFYATARDARSPERVSWAGREEPRIVASRAGGVHAAATERIGTPVLVLPEPGLDAPLAERVEQVVASRRPLRPLRPTPPYARSPREVGVEQRVAAIADALSRARKHEEWARWDECAKEGGDKLGVATELLASTDKLELLRDLHLQIGACLSLGPEPANAQPYFRIATLLDEAAPPRGAHRAEAEQALEMARAEVLARRRGPVRIETEPPGAEVWIDGRRTPGVTPLTVTVRLGEHFVTLRRFRFESQTNYALLQPRTSMRFVLQPAGRETLARQLADAKAGKRKPPLASWGWPGRPGPTPTSSWRSAGAVSTCASRS